MPIDKNALCGYCHGAQELEVYDPDFGTELRACEACHGTGRDIPHLKVKPRLSTKEERAQRKADNDKLMEMIAARLEKEFPTRR